MKLETIEHVESEVKRFLGWLETIRYIERENLVRKHTTDRVGEPGHWGKTAKNAHAAFRRSALDLKQALTYISQNKNL